MGGMKSFLYEALQLCTDDLTDFFLFKMENSKEFSRFFESLNANGKKMNVHSYASLTNI